MFAEHGASGLVLSDLDPKALSASAAAARRLGARVEEVAGDVTKDDVMAAMVAAAGKLGRLDVIVNNAGARRAQARLARGARVRERARAACRQQRGAWGAPAARCAALLASTGCPAT